jgi:ubiquinone/menaquinone biosynthesis C-methylase UbiE
VLLGIPDLRIFPDPYIGFDQDRAKARALAERFHDFDFEGFVDFYYRMTDVVPPQHARLYKRGLMAAEARADDWLTAWEEAAGGPAPQSLLEIGCGTGPLLAVSKGYSLRVGVDIALRWLVVGKKRLAERGANVPLICACAEALPFADQVFDRVVADSTLEHLKDQKLGLAEAFRVLRPAGRLFVATPNRFSLGPDPQTGFWAGGYLPDSWTAALVRKAGGIPPVRKLLSAFSLRRLLREAGFARARLSLPGIPDRQRAQFSPPLKLLIGVYDFLRRLPVSRQFLYLFGPLLHATAEREK